jgi:uncharacterized protein DUF6174
VNPPTNFERARGRFRVMRITGLGAVAGLLVALALGRPDAALAGPDVVRAAPTQGPRVLLARARERWAAQHLRSYRFRLRLSCDCGAASARALEITVLDGRPVGARYFAGQLQTVPEMFRLIGQVLDDPSAGGASVRYDAGRGFPRAGRLDSISWVIDRFEPL